MENAKETLKSIMGKVVKNKIALLCIAIVIALLVVAVVLRLSTVKESSVDTTYLSSILMKSSELTSAKLHYTGMTEYTDTGVSFINRSDFIMVYEATVRAGVRMEDVKITADDANSIIYLEIPKAIVQDVKVDASSIKYFDQKFALFNVDAKEDSNEAISLAEKAATEEAANMGILELADAQAETLIMGILANTVPDGYTMKVKKSS